MANLKFEVVVDTTNKAELSATLAFLQALGGAKADPPKPKPAAAKNKTKPEPVQETTAPQETAAKPEETKVSIPALEDLQKLVQEKSGTFRKEMGDELKRLGLAKPGVAALYKEYQDSKPEVINEFETFVKGLK